MGVLGGVYVLSVSVMKNGTNPVGVYVGGVLGVPVVGYGVVVNVGYGVSVGYIVVGYGVSLFDIGVSVG